MTTEHRSSPRGVTLLLSVLLPLASHGAACQPTKSPVPPEDLDAVDDWDEGAACNPSDCYAYCERARCLFPDDPEGKACEAHCTEHCGDGWYEDAELAVFECHASIAHDPTCEQSRACCDEANINGVCPGHTDPPEVTCDPAGCVDYCQIARCLSPDDLTGEQCETRCQQMCGNENFEKADHELLACQAAVTDDPSCEQSQACCEAEPQNELCP